MGGTIAWQVGRGDLLIHRGMSERFGARWTQDRLDGSGNAPVDLSNWHAKWQMALPDGSVVDERDCTTNENGLAWVELPPDAYTPPAWDSRTTGSWKISARDPTGKHVEIIGYGYWTLI